MPHVRSSPKPPAEWEYFSTTFSCYTRILLEVAINDDNKIPLSDEFNRNNPTEKSGSLPPKSKDRSLDDAFNQFKSVLSTDGELDWSETYLDRSEQYQLMEQEARKLGVLYEGLEPVVEGGREHDLLFDDKNGSVLKFTKPSSAGYVVDFMDEKPRLTNGDPLEYLQRLNLHNEVFGDFTQFVGLGGLKNNRRIMTRQPAVVGRKSTYEEIEKLMVEDLGFTKLPHTYGIGYDESIAFIRDDVAVFDLRPANLFTTDTGMVIAIDSIPVRLNETNRKAFAQ